MVSYMPQPTLPTATEKKNLTICLNKENPNILYRMVEMIKYYPIPEIKSWSSGIQLASMLTTYVNGRVKTGCCNNSSLPSIKGRFRIKKKRYFDVQMTVHCDKFLQ